MDRPLQFSDSVTTKEPFHLVEESHTQRIDSKKTKKKIEKS